MAFDVDGTKENPPECIFTKHFSLPCAKLFRTLFLCLHRPASREKLTGAKLRAIPSQLSCPPPHSNWYVALFYVPSNNSRFSQYKRSENIYAGKISPSRALRFSSLKHFSPFDGELRTIEKNVGWSKCWCGLLLEFSRFSSQWEEKQSAEKFSQAK